MTNSINSTLPRAGAATANAGGTTTAATTASYPSMPPVYLDMTSSGSAAHVTLDLAFSTAMKAGSGAIWVTDGAVQTVIDPATGLTSLRIVGATDTHPVAPSGLRFDGDHVFIDAYGLKPGLVYSVIITPGALVSTADKAFAGLRSPGYAAFSAPGSDTTAPALASIEFDSTTVKAGHDIRVKLTFSEKLGSLDEAAFSAPHAQLTGLETVDGITWHGWLRATEPGITATGNTLGIDMAKVRDLAGNAGTGTLSSAPYDVDTIVTSHVAPDMGLYGDAGPYWDDLVTNGASQLIEGEISGRMGEGEHFELLLDGVKLDNVELHMNPEGSPAGYWWSALAELAEGSHTLVARVVGAGHSSGEVVRQIVIDNTAPVFTSSADGAGAFGLDTPVVIKLAEKAYWDSSEGSDDAIEVEDREGNISYRPFSAVQVSDDGLTLTIPASVLALTAGNDYTIRLPATLTDLAGNNFAGQEIHLHTAGAYVDVMPPRALSAKVVNHAGTYGVGAEIEIRVKFNEPVALVDGAKPTLGLNNGGTATFVAINAANEMVFKYVVQAGQDTWELDIRDVSALLGSVADLAAHRLDGDHVEFWMLDNDTAENHGSDIVIVTAGPAPLALPPQLASGSDTGAPGDHISGDSTPTFGGNGVLPGARVFLYDGESEVASSSADAAGNWSLTPALPLADGMHNFNVRHADAYGNRSGASPSYALQIDSNAGVPSAPALEASSDSNLAGDAITSDNTPTFSGSGAEAGATISLYEGGTKLGGAVADASGRWSVTTAPLSEGAHAITASQVDIAGNRSADSPATTVRIDTAAATLAAPTLDAGSDSGAPGDRLTNDNSPTLRGSGAEANATIELYAGSALAGTTTADGSGNWSLTCAPRADGEHTFTVRQVDTAGNRSEASAALVVKIDSAAAGAPGAPLLSLASDSGTAGDLVTNVATPTLTGAGAEAGSTVELYAGIIKLGEAVADASGAWSITSIPRADGIYTLTTRQVDTAGNRSPESAGVTVKIDATAPDALAAPQLDLSSDTGTTGDNFTRDNTPTMTGNGAEAGARIALYSGSTLLGESSADASGHWWATASVLPDGFSAISVVQIDAAGNRSLPSVGTTVRVRTSGGPAVTALELASDSDSGTSGDGLTNDTTPTIKGSGAEPGAMVDLYVGDRKVGSAPADGSGNWSVTSSTLADGNYAFTAKQVDAAGNTSPVSSALAVRIDTSANAAPGEPMLGPDRTPSATGGMATNDNTPRIAGGDAVAAATIRLYVDGAAAGSTKADSAGNWAIDLATPLSDGNYVLTATQTNDAGNESAHSANAILTIDTAVGAPSVALDAASDHGTPGDGLTNVATPTIKGSAEAGASIVLYEGATVRGTATADVRGDWSLVTTGLTDGSHTLFATQTDVAGNLSAASSSLQVTIDTVAPAKLAAPGLAAASDSGAKDDRITNDNTPTIAGSGADAGATIQVLDANGGVTGTTTADASGNWSFDITAVFLDGGYGIFARQVDAAGNLGPQSDNVAFYFDTVVGTPNIALMPASDPDGTWDYYTRVNTPTFGGTGEANATVKVYAGTTEVGSTTVDASGNWSLTTRAVADGMNSFTAVQTDRAGNVSSQGGPIPVTVDTSAAAPGTPLLDVSTDSGVLGDGHTTNTAPKFSGSGAEAFSKIQLYAGTDKLGETTADAAGNWSVTSHTLLTGSYLVTALQVDKAGNTSASSAPLSLVIETLLTSVTFSAERADVAGSGSASGADAAGSVHQPLATLVGVSSPWMPLADAVLAY